MRSACAIAGSDVSAKPGRRSALRYAVTHPLSGRAAASSASHSLSSTARASQIGITSVSSSVETSAAASASLRASAAGRCACAGSPSDRLWWASALSARAMVPAK